MSITECCFKNTVDTHISTAAATKNILQPTVLNLSMFHADVKTASEPITCIDGHTLVFVSKR